MRSSPDAGKQVQAVTCSGKLIPALSVSMVISTEYVPGLSRWQGLMGSLEMQYTVCTCNSVPGGAVQFTLFRDMNSLSVKRLGASAAEKQRCWLKWSAYRAELASDKEHVCFFSTGNATWWWRGHVFRLTEETWLYEWTWRNIYFLEFPVYRIDKVMWNTMHKTDYTILRDIFSIIQDQRLVWFFFVLKRRRIVLREVIIFGFSVKLWRVLDSAKQQPRNSKTFHQWVTSL